MNYCRDARFGYNWARLAPNGTNLGVFIMIFLLIFIFGNPPLPGDKMWGCSLGWRGYRGSCYQVLKAPGGMDWATAKSVCSSKLANLATIVDSSENRFIFSILPKSELFLHFVNIS